MNWLVAPSLQLGSSDTFALGVGWFTRERTGYRAGEDKMQDRGQGEDRVQGRGGQGAGQGVR